MKLNSFRPKDEAHLEILDNCGLITPAIESDLPAALKERMTQARERFSVDEGVPADRCLGSRVGRLTVTTDIAMEIKGLKRTENE